MKSLKQLVMSVLITLILMGALNGFSKKLKTKEDFYRLYYLSMNYDKSDLDRNLFWLNIAIYAAFAPVHEALVYCDTEDKYERYKLLLKMHLNYLMAQNELYRAALFDKHEPTFYTKIYKEDILKSLDVAEVYYKQALWYWDWVLKYKSEAQSSYKKVRIDLQYTEDIIVRIDSGDLDLKRVAQRQLDKLDKTRAYYNE